jgi:hypothetical protein
MTFPDRECGLGRGSRLTAAMASAENPATGKSRQSGAREVRLQAALRENLKRRKAQARGRSVNESEAPERASENATPTDKT